MRRCVQYAAVLCPLRAKLSTFCHKLAEKDDKEERNQKTENKRAENIARSRSARNVSQLCGRLF